MCMEGNLKTGTKFENVEKVISKQGRDGHNRKEETDGMDVHSFLCLLFLMTQRLSRYLQSCRNSDIWWKKKALSRGF